MQTRKLKTRLMFGKHFSAKQFIRHMLLISGLIATYAMRSDDDLHTDKTTRIDAGLLTGQWQSVDTPVYTIAFTTHSSEVILFLEASRSYYFMIDSNHMVSSGFSPNWPPYDADLNMVGKDTLEITYAQIGVPDLTARYIRK